MIIRIEWWGFLNLFKYTIPQNTFLLITAPALANPKPYGSFLAEVIIRQGEEGDELFVIQVRKGFRV